jgi:hypothetical protein
MSLDTVQYNTLSPFAHPLPLAPPAAALQQPAQGQNLAYLAGGNFLRELGIENSSEASRILDIAMNPNSLYALNNRKQVGREAACLTTCLACLPA